MDEYSGKIRKASAHVGSLIVMNLATIEMYVG